MAGLLNHNEEVFRDLKLTSSKILSEYNSTVEPQKTIATNILAYRDVMKDENATKDIQTYSELLDNLQKIQVTSKGGKDKVYQRKAKSKKQKAKSKKQKAKSKRNRKI